MNWKKIQEINEELKKKDKEYQPDKWQQRVLDHKGNVALRTGRQVGKSVTIARKCADLALQHKDITILMIAAAQRQSSEIFQKTFRNLDMVHKELLKKAGGWKPKKNLSAKRNMELKREFETKHGLFKGNITKTEMNLKNNVRILSLPTGKSGDFVRCYTVDVLIADEAAFIPEPVWTAVRPMLATSKKRKGLGWEILLSTPFGRGGHYYEACHDPDYLQIHVSSEQCARVSQDFLKKERQRLSKKEYAQEYLGEFVAEFNQFFKTELIKACMSFISWDYTKMYDKGKKYFLGVDIARYGEDENAFVVAEMNYKGNLKIVHAETTERKSLTDTAGRIVHLHNKFNFKKVFTDDSGLGAGVTDMLIERIGKNKVMGINNSKKTVDDDKQKGILKEDLYSNALALMEDSKIEIIADLPLQRSLKNITFNYTSYANLRIFGKKSHLAEAFVRACWATKAKSLKLFIA